MFALWFALLDVPMYQNARLMVHGLIFPAVLSMNRVKKRKFPDFAREFLDTAQMTGQAVSVNLIA